MKIIREIEWKWFMLKMKYWGIKQETIDKYMRKNYCRYGIHHLKSNGIKYGGSGQRMKLIRWLGCRYCKYMFFAKLGDKLRYEQYNRKTKDDVFAFINHSSSRKSKHSKPVGE